MEIKVLDTNILLLDAENLVTIGNETDIVVIPEVVLAEIDSKKSGHDEINYQARQFGRLISGAEVCGTNEDGNITITDMRLDNVVIWIVGLRDYGEISIESANDQRIMKTASSLVEYGNVELISNDVLMRIRAIANGLNVSDYKVVDNVEFDYVKSIEMGEDDQELFRSVHNKSVYELDSEYKSENYHYKLINTITGQVKLCSISNGMVNVLGKDTEKEVRKQSCPPVNTEQLLLSRDIQDPSVDLVVVEGMAGSGKNICAVSNAMRLLKLNKDKYDSIVYVRSPINDEDSGEDIGYLSSNESKYAMYLGPMEDTLDFIARSNLM